MAGAQCISQTRWVGAMFRSTGWCPGIRGGLRGRRKGHRRSMGSCCGSLSSSVLQAFAILPQIFIHLNTNSTLRLDVTEAINWKLPSFLPPANTYIHQHLPLSCMLGGKGVSVPALAWGLFSTWGTPPSASSGTVQFIVPSILQISKLAFSHYYSSLLSVYKHVQIPPSLKK